MTDLSTKIVERVAKAISKSELRVLVSVYHSTDCCNEVYDYGALHHKQEPIAQRLQDRGLLVSIDGVVCVDGDGFTIQPERYKTGWRLTLAGYEALTSESPERWPADDDHRRFARLAADAKETK